MDIKFTPATFSASEVAKITGVSLALQRNWRRRGHVTANQHVRATFSALETAEMLALGCLSAGGIGPAIGVGVAESAGLPILVAAQRQPGAVADPEGLLKFPEDPIKARAGHLARFMRVTPEGESVYTDDLNTAAAYQPAPWALVLDLAYCGEQLAQRAGRPLFTVVKDD